MAVSSQPLPPSRGAIRRGSFGSVKELIAKIYLFAANWNAGASPFAWVKNADEILAQPFEWKFTRADLTKPSLPRFGETPGLP